MAQQAQTPMKSAYALTEREGKTYWSRCGVAFENRDGSLTIQLDCLPVSGRLQVRQDEPREAREREPTPRDRDGGKGHRR